MPSPYNTAIAFVLLAVCPAPGNVAWCHQTGGRTMQDTVAVRLLHADSAFRVGAHGLAEQEYLVVLEVDPWNSRATYRLAQLRRHNPHESLRLFRRYVELEPTDPWGYMAVGEAYAQLGEYGQGLVWYDRARHRAPEERDAVIGRARILARGRHTDAAIAAYHAWLDAHPSDAKAWQELSREQQRAGQWRSASGSLERAAALDSSSATVPRLVYLHRMTTPVVLPVAGGSRDSDGNAVVRAGVSADFLVANTGRLGVAVERSEVGDGIRSASLSGVRFITQWRPRATTQISGEIGLAYATAASDIDGGLLIPTLHIRTRWRAPGNRASADIRLSRAPLRASPTLIANRIVTEDLRAIVGVPATKRLRLRALGRMTTFRGGRETNWRRGVGAVVAVVATDEVEVSAQLDHTSFQNMSRDGYFAPRLIQSLTLASYMEFYPTWVRLVAVDLGAGVQRTARHRADVTGWKPALRFWGQLSIPIALGADLDLEVEAYHSQMGTIITTSSEGWQYVALVAALRVSVP